ncbi:hypothetical protein [Bacillus sp. AFS096315]|uniref:nucleotide-binding domain-containing protein n=1 Tax=Bacillaceae TaxID=186817 RepID=UPI00336A1042
MHEFHCDHYVVCYIVKNGECVARNRIPVTILVIEFPLFFTINLYSFLFNEVILLPSFLN